MANTFTLAGTFKDAKNNPIYVGEYVVFRITSVGTDSEDAVAYPRDPVSMLIDENGDFGDDLWVNGDSGTQCFYEVRDPSGQRLDLIFPSETEATTVRYEFALENYLAAASPQQGSPALEAHIADQGNPHVVTAAQVGLGATDNVTFAQVQLGTSSGDLLETSGVGDIGIRTNGSRKLTASASGVSVTGALTLSTDLAITEGGTGASTAAAAKVNLGLDVALDNVQTTITDTDLAVPTSGAVMDYADPKRASEIFVTDESQLDGVLDSSKVYVIDPAITMSGAVTISVPSGGLSFRSTGAITAGMTCTADNYTMFDGGGILVITGIAFTTSGTNSKVFDLTAANATDLISIDRSAFVNCTSVGEITGYSALIQASNQYIACAEGITLSGNMDIIQRSGCASAASISGATMYKEGTSLVIANRFLMTSCNDTVDAGVTLCDFQPSNFTLDGGFELFANVVQGAGDFFSEIEGSDPKCLWTGNRFIPPESASNTAVGGRWHSTADESIAVLDGVYDYPLSTLTDTTPVGLTWFTAGTANDLTYGSSLQTGIEIKGVSSISSSTNNTGVTIKMVLLDASNAYAEVDLDIMPILDLKTAGDALQIPILAYATVDEGDIIRLSVKANKNATITFSENTSITITSL